MTTLSPGMTLDDLLAVEDDPSLLEYGCQETCVPLWPIIRNQFFRFVMTDRLFKRSLVEQERGANFRRNFGGAAYAVARAVRHNWLVQNSLSGRVLLTTGGAGLQKRDGLWFNRLTDYFASASAEETVVLEDLFKWQWRFPRHYERVLFHTPLFLRGYVVGRLRVKERHTRSAEGLVRLVRGRARRLLAWELGDQRAAFLVRLLAREAAAMPEMSRAYEELLTRLKVRIVIKEMGCYGRSSVFNATARGMGLTVAEHQHGLVSAGHDAYNLAPSLARSSEYRRTLPEYFLSYGAWWGEQISVPVTAVIIGNPHRTERLDCFKHRPVDRTDILILGDGIETSSYLDLARELAKKLARRWRVVFRPHPIERESVQSAYRSGADGVYIDQHSDIYESFAFAYAVVSEASTGLFESVGLVERIFALETARGRFSLPRHPFTPCIDARDLAEKIAEGSTGYPDLSDVHHLWAPNWQSNYLGFLKQHLGN